MALENDDGAAGSADFSSRGQARYAAADDDDVYGFADVGLFKRSIIAERSSSVVCRGAARLIHVKENNASKSYSHSPRICRTRWRGHEFRVCWSQGRSTV